MEQKEIDVEKLYNSVPPKKLPSSIIDKPKPPMQQGKVTIWRIEEFEKVPYPEEMHGQFFSCDSYIILYTYEEHGSEKHVIYFWQGRDSTTVLHCHTIMSLIPLYSLKRVLQPT
jgi:hypothetical protein